MAASVQVFGTYELLEDVLLHLPLFDLLLAERVSKEFQSIIKRSQKIGQVLFRDPIIANTTMVYRARRFSNNLLNSWYTTDGMRHHPIVNPFIDCFSKGNEYSGHRILHNGFIDMSNDKGQHGIADERVEAFLRKKASWKSTLMLQPPPHIVRFTCSNGKCKTRDIGVAKAGGVTMNVLRRRLLKHKHKYPVAPVSEDFTTRWWWNGGTSVETLPEGITGWETLEEMRIRPSIMIETE